ncbi:MAG: 6-phosphogluconate dehydrogenase [Rhodospirillaceae bacterium]|jgi:3-hydroxyisobutyrate dehydrogenase-like beta-hydroxyacid dehydrogenase|nr:6-phosphogluconate dehydrogenase [Rhodospirillaceae bacterium]
MAENNLKDFTVGWIGVGRMGYAMVERLLKVGADVSVWNRTRSKAEPLAELGATVVDNPTDLADRDIVFTMVGGPDDFIEVTTGAMGVLTVDGQKPRMLIDCTTISEEASKQVREYATKVGTAMIDAPVSGNAKVVAAGKLSIVASGDKEAFEEAEPYLLAVGEGVSYVGEGELARMVKICHNVYLGVVAQSLAEITVLAEKGGVPRHAFLDFINKSVMGSPFSAYKTPAMVNLDFTPTFTPLLLRKDMDLGLSAAHNLEVPMPIAAMTREIIQNLIGSGYTDCDFAALIELEAKNAGYEIKSEDVKVGTGL